jgi:hypothetical protein
MPKETAGNRRLIPTSDTAPFSHVNVRDRPADSGARLCWTRVNDDVVNLGNDFSHHKHSYAGIWSIKTFNNSTNHIRISGIVHSPWKKWETN